MNTELFCAGVLAIEAKNPLLARKLEPITSYRCFRSFSETFEKESAVFLDSSEYLLTQQQSLSRLLQENGKIFIIEENLDRLSFVAYSSAAFFFLSHPSVEIIEKEQLSDAVLIVWAWKTLFRKKSYFLKEELFKPLEKMIFSVELTFSEYKDFGVDVFHHVLKNAARCHQALVGDELDLSGQTVIICAAGPSLEKEISFLKKAENKAHIWAAGSSAHYLFSQGVKFNVCAVVDPSVCIARYEFLKNAQEFSLFYSLRADPRVVEKGFKRKILFRGSGESPLEDFFWEEKEMSKPGFRERGWNVATFLASIAFYAGAKEIIFIGLDSGYVDGLEYPNDVIKEQREKPSILIENISSRKDLWLGQEFIKDLARKSTQTQFLMSKRSLVPIDGVEKIDTSVKKLCKSDLHDVYQSLSCFGEIAHLTTFHKDFLLISNLLEGVLIRLQKLNDENFSEYKIALELADLEDNLFYKLVLERVWQVWKPVVIRDLICDNTYQYWVQKCVFLERVSQSFFKGYFEHCT